MCCWSFKALSVGVTIRMPVSTGLDFVLISGASEVFDWESWISGRGIITVDPIQSLGAFERQAFR